MPEPVPLTPDDRARLARMIQVAIEAYCGPLDELLLERARRNVDALVRERLVAIAYEQQAHQIEGLLALTGELSKAILALKVKP